MHAKIRPHQVKFDVRFWPISALMSKTILRSQILHWVLSLIYAYAQTFLLLLTKLTALTFYFRDVYSSPKNPTFGKSSTGQKKTCHNSGILDLFYGSLSGFACIVCGYTVLVSGNAQPYITRKLNLTNERKKLEK